MLEGSWSGYALLRCTTYIVLDHCVAWGGAARNEKAEEEEEEEEKKKKTRSRIVKLADMTGVWLRQWGLRNITVRTW